MAIKKFISNNKQVINKILYCSIIALLFLIGIGFFACEKILAAILFFPLILYLLLNFRNIKTFLNNKFFYFILAFSFFFAFFPSIWQISESIKYFFKYLLVPLSFYLATIVERMEKRKFSIPFTILFFSLGMYIHVLLNMGITYSHFGFNIKMRWVMNFWTGNTMSCTLISMFLLPFTGICVFYFFNFFKKPFISIPCCLVVTYSVICSMQLANRGFLLSFIVGLFISLLIYLKNYTKNAKRNIVYLFACCVGFFLIFLILKLLYAFNTFGFKDAVKNINIIERIFNGGSNKERLDLYSIFFKNFFKYPFGNMVKGVNIDYFMYVHNTFLDVYCIGGFIPTFLLLFLTIISFKNLFSKQFILDNNINFGLIISFSMFISIFLLEPVIYGSTYVFALFFTYVGSFNIDKDKGNYIFNYINPHLRNGSIHVSIKI